MAALPLRWRLFRRPPAAPHASHRFLAPPQTPPPPRPPTSTPVRCCSSSSSTSEADPHPPQQRRPFRLALVGRPNVGKSTLFNRLTGGGRGWAGGAAIVTDVPGTTRDRKEGRCSFGGLKMAVVDTGGLEEAEEEKEEEEEEGKGDDDDEGSQQRWRQRRAARAARRRMQALINAQVEAAVKESDAVLLVVDARAGVGPEEEHLARWLLRMGAKGKALVVANKAEGGVLSPAMQSAVYDAYAFGFPGDPIPVSAAHNEGISDLAAAVVELAKARGFAPAAASTTTPDEEEENDEDDVLTVAFIGLPNVGKSSLLNALLHGPSPNQALPPPPTADGDGEEGEGDRYPRLIASDVAGTTRDAVLVDYEWRGRRLRLVDTAGIRKKGRWDHGNKLERLAVEEALRAIRYANVVVLVLDGQQLRLRRQEQTVADTAFKEGRALVVAANKSDLLASSPKAFAQGVRDQLQLLSPQLGSLPVVPVSALTGQGVGGLLPAVARAYRAWNTRVSTGTLNRWLLEVQRYRSPPLTSRGRVVKLKYITQVKTRPPTFALVANTREIDDSYVRFLKNKLQEEFGLHGMDIRLSIKSTSDTNPFASAGPARKDSKPPRRRSGSSDGQEDEENEEEARQRRQAREAARSLAARRRDEARGQKAYRTRTVGSSPTGRGGAGGSSSR